MTIICDMLSRAAGRFERESSSSFPNWCLAAFSRNQREEYAAGISGRRGRSWSKSTQNFEKPTGLRMSVWADSRF